MLGGANLLVLDEPTNHLDIDSIEVLEAQLESFDGTAVFTSHDRYFLDRIADRIVEVADGDVRSHEGATATGSRSASACQRSRIRSPDMAPSGVPKRHAAPDVATTASARPGHEARAAAHAAGSKTVGRASVLTCSPPVLTG